MQLRTLACAAYALIAMSALNAWAYDSSENANPDNANSSDISLAHLTLSNAERLFKTNNREVLQAKRAIEASQADAITAGQRPNPTLSINSTNLKLTQSNGSGGLAEKTLDTIVRIDQLVERGNKREIRKSVAQDAIQAAQFDFKDTVRQQKYNLRSTYFDLLLAEERESVQKTNQQLFDKSLQAAEVRLKAGDIPSADVSRIRVDALRALNDVRQAQADRAAAQANLAYLIGKEKEAAALSAEDNWPTLDANMDQTLATDMQQLMDNRPDIKAALAREQLASDNRRLAESLTTRDITIGAQYEHFPTDSRNTVGAGISIPLFTNYQYQGEIARAEVDYTAAMEAKEQTSAQAIGEITRAKTALSAAADKLRRFDEQMLSEAQKAADSAEFAYNHGAVGVTDLLDARRTLRALQLEAVSARADYAKAMAAWQAVIHPEEN